MTTKIDLSNLELKEVEIINERPKILILDKNNIAKIDKLLSQTQLQQLSIAHNQIIQINGLSSLVNLTVLNLPNNKIISIDGIKPLCMLTWLNLSNNRIKTIEHLETNLQLKHLDLSDNIIGKLSNISFLNKLKTFLLHGNRITNIDKIGEFLSPSIEILSLAENQIYDLTEIRFLEILNLRQLSIRDNPCIVNTEMNINIDYRPYIINWCLGLKILDGVEVSEKEILVAEWLCSLGKGRKFKKGDHFELINYLTRDCAFTNLKNKSKLNNDLNTIIDQRKRLSFKKSHTFRSSQATSVEDKSESFNFKSGNPSTHLDETDLNCSISTSNDDGFTTNTSMLISESSFLPISPLKPNSISPNPQRTMSPTIKNKSNINDTSDVPTLKFSKENPKLCSKNVTKSILNSSFEDFHSEPLKEIYNAANPKLKNEDTGIKFIKSSVVIQQSNNNASIIHSEVEISSATRIQAWWRSVLTRKKHPIVKRFLHHRESHRIKSHILFLQKQMRLYYESYEQQRQLNATQNQAIQFLLDEVKNLSIWREQSTIREENSKIEFSRAQNQPYKVCKDNCSQATFDLDPHEKERLQNKIENLEEQVSTLKESVWKLENTVHRTLQFDDNSKMCRTSQNISEYTYSEESDLNRVICEVEKIYRNGSRVSINNSESNGSDLPLNDCELPTLRNDNHESDVRDSV